MLCERCNKKKATVFYRENINGKARAFRLCGDCATTMQQSGELEDLSSAFARFSSPFALLEDGLFGDLFSLPMDKRSPAVPPSQTSSRKCPLCGATFKDISAKGKVGCATCYKTFADELDLPLRATHGKTAHVGRTPRNFRAKQERTRLLAELKKQLKEAVNDEKFEEAATLRDRIRAMEAEA